MQKYSKKRRLGNFAEDIVARYLTKNGFHVKERNYLKKWGELDIIATRNGMLHFIEVKSSFSRENTIPFEDTAESQSYFSRIFSQFCFTDNNFKIIVSREIDDDTNLYRPEENVHKWKQKRIIRALQTYLLEREINEDVEWQIDIIVVKIDFHVKTAIIRHIENVVFL